MGRLFTTALAAVLALLVSVLLPSNGHTESCNTDCHNQCRVKTSFPPIEFIEPTCHAKCEIAKKAACAAGQSVPNVPLTPREQVETGAINACAAGFQVITNFVIARCSNWDGRLDNQHLLDDAIRRLELMRLIAPGVFNGVQVRWCPLNGAHGMAPDRGRVYVDVSLQNNSFATLTTLAHESVHLQQYRSLGTDRFKCDYSREYVRCGSCQDNGNSFEREAYAFENNVAARLSQNGGVGPGFAPPGNPSPGFASGFVMQGCGCWGPSAPSMAPEPRCQRGSVRLEMCNGFCPGGGNPYGFVCQ